MIGVFGCLSISSNCLLFLWRIYAVFHGNRIICTIYTVLWFGVLAAAMTAPFSLSGIRIGTTHYCSTGGVHPYGSGGEVAAAINDTLVFLAVTLELSMKLSAPTWRDRVRVFFSGKGMGDISRAVLQGGQKYYLYVLFNPTCSS